VRRGWLIVLIHGIVDGRCTCGNPRCRSPGKHPATPNGVKDATKDLKRLKSWLKKYPDANIAIATGEGSDLLVLDVDPRNGGTETLEKLKKPLGKLPATITSLTGGGGFHFFYPYPSFTVKKDNAGRLLGPGIDVQTNGCYVVVPSSRHPSGKPYKWLEGSAPGQIELAELPEALAKCLEKSATGNIEIKLNDPPANAVLEGRRNSHLLQLAGVLKRLDKSHAVILATLTAENQVNCHPPLDQSEVEAIAESIARYPASPLSGSSGDLAHGVMNIVLAACRTGFSDKRCGRW
jgi:putative DNA primase/helicase